jgi:hypothetical protein
MVRLLAGLGLLVRIVVLGELLFLAILVMYAMGSGARVFQYAGF